IKQAELYYKKVEREDNAKAYASAQLNLGTIYEYDKEDIKQAELYYNKVEREDNAEAYALAQLNLGRIYHFNEDKKNIAEAELYYKKVEREDNAKAYALAQFNLGRIYHFNEDKKNIAEAKEYYNSVKKEDNARVYAKAQFNLGRIYHFNEDKKNIAEAELYYNKVEREDNAKAYASAQFFLGTIYEYDKEDIKQAELYYNKVEREDNAKAYALAQFNLGRIYYFNEDKKNIAEAKEYYNRVKKEDNAEVYALAQLNLGFIYQDDKNDPELAVQFFSQARDSGVPLISSYANYCLGEYFYFNQKEKYYEKSKNYYQLVNYSNRTIYLNLDIFKAYIVAQIMLAVSNIEENDLFKTKEERDNLVIKPICQIRKLTEKIQKELLVTFKLDESESEQGQQFERRVAHYTNPSVLFELLKNDSHVRLNVVDFMNDPTENQLLSNWLGMNNDPNSEIKSFLTSFTFNHNCLNQFRLYGNENNIIGSGVSLVFNQFFFGKKVESSINPDSVALLSYDTKVKVTKSDSEENKDKDDGDSNNICSLELLPLFRCLYFDPNSKYISIAKRNKFSFYLEHQGSPPETIEDQWNNYIDSLGEEGKIAKIRVNLNKIRKIITALKAKEELKALSNLDQLINLAIMPISCLIKHAAFEDEDECRMIYITHIADKKIQAPANYDYANSLFVNYGQKVEGYLDKIYLGPQCQPYHKLWITNHVRRPKSESKLKHIKVVQSEMPLR
ncbi:tetratricopeptide repeat protein, partial [Gilliamella sp. Pas-s27]|uniref:tetratricopeptide repeat protein n=1 Tax=Gilliamella sp. Pas-s27 TaxID=2687311 RepID=UPI001365D44C